MEKNPNDEKCLLNAIKEHHLTAQQVVETLQILKNKSSNSDIESKVSATIDGWNILNYMQDPKEIKVLLDSFLQEFDESFQQKLYLKTNENGDNILHSLCKKEDLSLLQHFLESIMKKMKDEKFLKKLLNSKSMNGNNFVHILCSNELNNLSVLQKIFQTIKSQLGANTVRELLCAINKDQYNILMICSRYQNVQGFIEVIELITKFLNNTDIKKSLKAQNINKQNFAQIIVNYSDSSELKSALSLVSTKFKDKRFFEGIICSIDDSESTILHTLSTQSSDAFLDVLQMNELDTSLTEKIFLGPDSKNNRILDRVCDDVGTFIDILEIFKDKHGFAFIANILSAQNDDKETVLKLMFYKNEMETSIEILDWLIVNINGEFIQYWFQIPNSQDEQIIHQISFYKSLKQLLPWMNEHLEKEFVTKMVKVQPTYQMNFLHILSRYQSDENSYLDLLKSMTKELGKDMAKELMLERSNLSESGWTFLLLLTRYNDQTPFLDLLKWLNSEFDKDFVKALLKAQEKNGWNFLHVICRYDTKTCIMDLINWLFQEFDITFMEELLGKKQILGWTCFNMLAQYNDNVPYLELLQLMVDKIGKEFIKEILAFNEIIVDEGWTFLLLLSGYNTTACLVDIMKWMKSQFGKEFLESQVKAVEKDGCTSLLQVALNRKDDALDVLRFYVAEFDDDVLRHLLFAANDEAMTFLHIICANSDKIYYQKFMNQLVEFMPENIMKLLMQTKDVLSRTPRTHHYHSVIKQKINPQNDSVLTESQKVVIEKQNQKDQQHKTLDGALAKKFLLSSTDDGWTYLHELCYQNDHLVIYDTLKKSIDNEFEKHKLRQVLSFIDNRGRTFLHILSRNEKADVVEVLRLLCDEFDKDLLAKIVMVKDTENSLFVNELTSHLPIIELYQLILDELDAKIVKDFVLFVKFNYKEKSEFIDLVSFLLSKVGRDFAESFLSNRVPNNSNFYKQFGSLSEKSYNFVTAGDSSFFHDMFKLWKIFDREWFSWEILAFLQSQFSDVSINDIIAELLGNTVKSNDDNWDFLQFLLKFSEDSSLEQNVSTVENEDDKKMLKKVLVIKDVTGRTLIERISQDKTKQLLIQTIELLSDKLEAILRNELLNALEKEGESFEFYSNKNEYKIAVYSFLQMMISEVF